MAHLKQQRQIGGVASFIVVALILATVLGGTLWAAKWRADQAVTPQEATPTTETQQAPAEDVSSSSEGVNTDDTTDTTPTPTNEPTPAPTSSAATAPQTGPTEVAATGPAETLLAATVLGLLAAGTAYYLRSDR